MLMLNCVTEFSKFCVPATTGPQWEGKMRDFSKAYKIGDGICERTTLGVVLWFILVCMKDKANRHPSKIAFGLEGKFWIM